MLGLIRGDLLACCATRGGGEYNLICFSVGRRFKEDG